MHILDTGALAQDPFFCQLYLPPLMCMKYLNRKRLDKATPQAVFYHPSSQKLLTAMPPNFHPCKSSTDMGNHSADIGAR